MTAAPTCMPWPEPHRCGRHVQPSGITLTSPWPPNNLTTATFYSNPPQRTRPPLYLKSPPRTVCLGVGRQLFIDNYLIDARRTTLRKSWHEATVVRLDAIMPDQAWEVGGSGRRGSCLTSYDLCVLWLCDSFREDWFVCRNDSCLYNGR